MGSGDRTQGISTTALMFFLVFRHQCLKVFFCITCRFNLANRFLTAFFKRIQDLLAAFGITRRTGRGGSDTKRIYLTGFLW